MGLQTQPYYECHITMEGTKQHIRNTVENAPNWKFSAIDGDPALGDGVKCYATKHYNQKYDQEDVQKWVNEMADYLRESSIKVIRQKIELVVYDVKETTHEH